MERLFLNLILFFKFFVFVFWIVFFGVFIVVVFVYKNEFYGEIFGCFFCIGFVIFFVSGLIMFFLIIMCLKCVEGNLEYLIIMDYFKIFRYVYVGIDKIIESKFVFLKLVIIYLKEKGSFGIKIFFIVSVSCYEEFMRNVGVYLLREKV